MTKKASTFKSLGFFSLGVLVFFGFRWGLYEPFVIPSGSMIPSLLVNDHILVDKNEYGLRWPFTNQWMLGPDVPARGDVVVFRSVKDPDFYMVKRVVALPGEVLQLRADGSLSIDGTEVPREEIGIEKVIRIMGHPLDEEDLRRPTNKIEFWLENFEGQEHITMNRKKHFDFDESFEVPQGEVFVMGDNRDSSQDSRFWGTLPLDNLLGKANRVWLSCQKGVRNHQVLCHPQHIRWQRLFYKIQ